ncbi:MAG: LysR family transcriptional regulator [Rickettsiales bacterium]|jgi:DNA-binding transcriptional LysR family regulator|nr:LysR family transcriptional regulator [Rickettsiales bacterium]
MQEINIKLYRTFFEVAKSNSISQAAKNLFVSQPNVSKSLSELEQQLGAELFHRTSKGVFPTAKGTELLGYIEQSFNSMRLAERRIREKQNLEYGHLVIGTPSNVCAFFLFDKIAAFHKEYPNVEITTITGGTKQLLNMLESHRIDIMIDTAPVNVDNPAFVCRDLATADYCFCASAESKIDGVFGIRSIRQLEFAPLILPIPGTANRNDINNLFYKTGIMPENIMNMHSSEIIMSMVRRDLGVGYLIRDQIRNDGAYKVLPIKERLPTVGIVLVYSQKYLNESSSRFISEYLCV